MASAADRLIYHLTRLGRPGAVGAVLLAAALAADAVLVQAMEAERDQLAEANERARLVRPAGERAQPAAPAELPLSPAAEAALARLFKAAEAAGLSLVQGDYKLSGEAGAGYRRYQLTLPVAGRYPAIRAFLAAALDGDPALALNDLRLARDEIGADELEARLHFTLYLREGQ